MTTCSHCYTKMTLVRTERTERSVLAQYRCPICSSIHLSSELSSGTASSQQVTEPMPLFSPAGLARA